MNRGYKEASDVSQRWQYFVLKKMERNFLYRVRNWEGSVTNDTGMNPMPMSEQVSSCDWGNSAQERKTHSLCDVQKSNTEINVEQWPIVIKCSHSSTIHNS